MLTILRRHAQLPTTCRNFMSFDDRLQLLREWVMYPWLATEE